MKQQHLPIAFVFILLLASCSGQLTVSPAAPTTAPTAAPNLVPTVMRVTPPTAPAAQPTIAPAIKAVPFDMGDGEIDQPHVAVERLRQMPIRLEGLIAAPPTGENLPIAIVIHGNHGTGCPLSPDGEAGTWPCPEIEKKHYQGFAYLLEALAAQGYVAVAIDANPAYAPAYGEPNVALRLPPLVDAYLAKIAAANNGGDFGLGVDLKGRIDWNKLVMLGHSQGGEGLNWVINSRADHTTPDLISGGGGPVAAAVFLAPPANSLPDQTGDLPITVILPACDQDVGNLSGQFNYERARSQADRQHLAASVYLPGAYHNGFNAALPSEAQGQTRSTCQPESLLPAKAHQDFLARYVPHFFNAALNIGAENPAAIGLDPNQPAPAQMLDRSVLTSLALPATQRLRLPLTTDRVSGTTTAFYCEPGLTLPPEKFEACRRTQFNQPGTPEERVISWNGANSAYEVTVPEGQQNLSGYDMLHLRAAVDPLRSLNAVGQPQSFSLRLTDGTGKIATVKLANEPALAFPAGQKGYLADLKLDTWDNHVILSSIRVSLSKFTGIDLNSMQSVALVFDQTEHGSILMTDLEFLKTKATE